MKLAIAAITGLCATSAFAQYYKTLPAGVRTAVYRKVVTSEVDSTFNKSSTLNPIAYNIEINAQTVEDLDDPTISSLFQTVKSYNPEAFNKMTAGAFKVSGAATMQVDAYGMGYGVTDKVTAYAYLPMYKADVRLKFQKTKNNNFQEVADDYAVVDGDSMAGAIGAFAEQVPDVLTGPTIQNMIMNTYNYQPMGDWHGEGPGDLEFGLMYNFFERDNYGLMATLGGVAPTGQEDDPDILQDVAFGDGQWDTFAELGGGYRFNDNFILNSYGRFTYQFAADKELRIPSGSDTSIGDRKGMFREKRGNKALYDIDMDYVPNDWINFNAAYIYETIGQSSYQSDYQDANNWLASNTDSSVHSVRLKAEVSTVTPFMKQKFVLPAQIKFFYQTTVAGVNTPDVDRYEVEFRMFF